MKVFQTKTKRTSGTDYGEVHGKANVAYHAIAGKTKRRPYVRSAYFKKEKVFLDYFWQHLHQKNWKDRIRRLKLYPCALELIQNSRVEPITKQNPNKSSEMLHRFAGITRDKELFFVQIREDKKRKQKDFMSVFPAE